VQDFQRHPRHDFSAEVKSVLARRVAQHCSLCGQATSGPQADPRKAINTGVAAHITAAAPGGPRYDASLTPSGCSSPENGIWLCQSCGKLVDSDPDRYTVPLLRNLKRVAEATVLASLEIDDPNYLHDLAEQEKQRLEDASKLNLARIREQFSSFQPIVIYLGLPLAAKVVGAITGAHDYLGQFASFGIAGIVALADIAKSRRKEWVSCEASYYCKLRNKFNSISPVPRSSRPLYRMMEEFIND